MNIAKSARRIVGALTPIDLFNKAQLRKLGTSSKGFQQFFTGMGDLITANMQGIKSTIGKHGHNAELGSIKDYMSGFKIGENRLDLSSATQKFRAKVRQRAAMGIGLYAGTSLAFGSDSPIPSATRAVGTAGMHAGITAGLYKYAHPMAGAAYAGLGLYNMTRPGNNFGAY